MRLSRLNPGLHLAAVIILAAAFSPVFTAISFAGDSDLPPLKTNWCYTQIKFDEEMRAAGMVGDPMSCYEYGPCDNPTIRDPWIPDSSDPITYVRIVIHYLANSDGTDPITTPEEIQEYVDYLNAEYLPYRIQFVDTSDLICNTAWRSLSENEVNQMKSATAIAPSSRLNIWVTGVEFGYSFGTFPFSSSALTATGGIIIHHLHWIGGPYSTLAHEIGHCLGLYHTFNGVDEVDQCGPCYEPVGAENANVLGDRCADTPPTPTFYNCGNTPGTDPCTELPWGYTMPENLMGYTPQTCRTMFTSQQAGRMLCWLNDVLVGWIIGIKVDADQTFGPAPLPVQFTTATAKTALSWSWDFGDGGTSDEANPFHLFETPGKRDVTITIQTPEGPFVQHCPGLVSTYADSLGAVDVTGLSGHPVKVDIAISNYLQVLGIVLPIYYGGPLGLSYDSFTVAGTRTESFESATLLNLDKINKRLTVVLSAGSGNELSPGSGPILSLYLRIPSWAQTGTNPIDVSGYLSYVPKLTCPAGDYLAEAVEGTVTATCCSGTVGNVNFDYLDQVDIGDLTKLIDYLFISYFPPYCMAEANCNGSADGVVDIGDLTKLIDYLFISQQPLPDCL